MTTLMGPGFEDFVRVRIARMRAGELRTSDAFVPNTVGNTASTARMPQSPGCPFCETEDHPQLLGQEGRARSLYAFECRSCGGRWFENLGST